MTSLVQKLPEKQSERLPKKFSPHHVELTRISIRTQMDQWMSLDVSFDKFKKIPKQVDLFSLV